MRLHTAPFFLSFLFLTAAPSAWGATSTTRPAPQSTNISQSAAPTAPVFPPDARWVWGLIILVIGLFVAAAVIGPIYFMSLPEALPVTHSHDEPPGSSHHHGDSGTMDFSAPDR
jgi:hypothetical protein